MTGPGRRIGRQQFLREERERQEGRPPSTKVLCLDHGSVERVPGTYRCSTCQDQGVYDKENTT